MYHFQNYSNFYIECKLGKHKTAFRAWKVTRTLKKQAPGPSCSKAGKYFPLKNLYLEDNAVVFPTTVESHLTATSVIWSPCYYGYFFSPSKTAIHFLIKNHPLIRSQGNTANTHILKSQTVESLIISLHLYATRSKFRKLKSLWHVSFFYLVPWACSCTVFRLQYSS